MLDFIYGYLEKSGRFSWSEISIGFEEKFERYIQPGILKDEYILHQNTRYEYAKLSISSVISNQL